jgi:serine/threonine-protein kinase
MSATNIRVLLIEDSETDADLIMCYLADETGGVRFEVEWVQSLAEGLMHLDAGSIDAVLSDLSLPDADGLETFHRIRQRAEGVPVVVLTGLEDTAVAMEAVKDGAQDYLFKGDISGRLLVRAMRFAIERKRAGQAQRIAAQADAAQKVEPHRPRLKNVCLECLKEFPDEVDNCPEDGSPLSKLACDRMLGTVLADRYEILSVLGSGGMSSIYKAKHVELGKLFAIKVIHAHFASDLLMVKRFRQEAQAVSLLSHPNVISVQDFGITPDGQPYIVMDFLDGIDLRSLIGKPMPHQNAIPIFTQICDGLAHAHEHQVIHRDLKPDNIMIIPEDTGFRVKIVDFGLAKSMQTTQKLTRTGDVFGSPHYMSPEHCAGEPLDPRTDIYSLGCIMYECLSGHPPFDSDNPIQVVHKHLHESPPPLACDLAVPEWLTREVMRALEKDRQRRHASARALKEALAVGSPSL